MTEREAQECRDAAWSHYRWLVVYTVPLGGHLNRHELDEIIDIAMGRKESENVGKYENRIDDAPGGEGEL